jgi:hypothetical protein
VHPLVMVIPRFIQLSGAFPPLKPMGQSRHGVEIKSMVSLRNYQARTNVLFANISVPMTLFFIML